MRPRTHTDGQSNFRHQEGAQPSRKRVARDGGARPSDVRVDEESEDA